MRERVFVNLLAMTTPQVVVNIKTRLTNYIAKREDVTVVRSGSHFISFLVLLSFVPYVPFCGFSSFLRSSAPCGPLKWAPSYIFLPRRKVFCTTPFSGSPSYGVS